MNNLETSYSVIGTAALKAPEQELCQSEHIIEFPGIHPRKSAGMHAKAPTAGYMHSAAKKLRKTELISDLQNGSVSGKAFNSATPLQSGLIGCGIFALIMVCAFFGA